MKWFTSCALVLILVAPALAENKFDRCAALSGEVFQRCIHSIVKSEYGIDLDKPPTVIDPTTSIFSNVMTGKPTPSAPPASAIPADEVLALERQRLQLQREELEFQREQLERQRETQLEAARIQALGMFLGGGGFMRPLPQQPIYQPAPVIPFTPLAQPSRPVPPIACTSQPIGQVTQTYCY